MTKLKIQHQLLTLHQVVQLNKNNLLNKTTIVTPLNHPHGKMVFQNKLIPIVKTSTKTVNINLTRSKKPSEKMELKEQKRKAVLQSIHQQIK